MTQAEAATVRSIGGHGSRRRFVCIGAAAGMATFAWGRAYAILLRHPVERSNVRIALPDFLAGTPADGEPARLIAEAIAANLERGRRFVLIDHAAFPDKIPSPDEWPRFPDWRAIRTAALLIGRVTRLPDGRIEVVFRLWDVSGATQLIGRQYLGTPDNYPRIANIISDDVYDALLGEPGHFDAGASPR
jgi:TolB protein